MVVLEAFFWIVFIIGLVIFIHELGHFLTAKLLGVKVEEFALGIGKKIFGKKVGNTLYRINAIPYGGYVKLLGEEEESKDSSSFSNKPVWVRLIVISGGVVMNFFLAVFIFYVILGFRNFEIFLPRISDYKFLGTSIEVQNKPIVAKIIEDTPADEADFPTDVIIWSIDDIEIKEVIDLSDYLNSHKGELVEIEVLTFEGERSKVEVTPRDTEKEGVLLGVEFYNAIASYYKLDYSRNKLFVGLLHSINVTGYNLEALKTLIGYSVKERTVKPVAEGVQGVVGLANMTLALVRVGDIYELMNWIALINISLAIMNMLPIPVLDGGHILFIFIEKVRGKKISKKWEERMMKISIIVLIALTILITIKDIIQFNIISRIFTWSKNLIN